jgi:hypothetical protein
MFKEGRRHSKGAVVMPNGDQYDGETLDELPNGRGTMIFVETGERYEGSWVEGKRTGYGRVTYANGDSFNGEWLNDRKQGTGTYNFADGRVLSSKWLNDQAEGTGTMKLPSSESYSGRWEGGELVGEVDYRWPNGRVYTGDLTGIQGFSFSRLKTEHGTYLGSLLDALPHGLGSLSHQAWASKYVVHGSWNCLKIEGYAEKTLSEGERYKGWWTNSKLNGQGSYEWLDGTAYSGHWENNRRSGFGVIKLPNGSKYEGVWDEDELVETYTTKVQTKPSHELKPKCKQVNRLIFQCLDDPRQQLSSSYQGLHDYERDDDYDRDSDSEDDYHRSCFDDYLACEYQRYDSWRDVDSYYDDD